MTFVGNTTPALEFEKIYNPRDRCGCDRRRSGLRFDRATGDRCARHVYVTVTGAHGIVGSVYDDRIREAHEQAAIVVPDGMPLVWLGRLLGFGSIGRVYGPDLMAGIFSREELRQLRHYFYGGTPAGVDRLTATLTRVSANSILPEHILRRIRPKEDSTEDENVRSHMRQ